MQATYGHAPPTRAASTSATERPPLAVAVATSSPADPAPSTMTSKVCMLLPHSDGDEPSYGENPVVYGRPWSCGSAAAGGRGSPAGGSSVEGGVGETGRSDADDGAPRTRREGLV